MATVLYISTPGGGLTYEDGDIIQALPLGMNPGSAVVANENEDWSFVYIEDKDPSDPEIVALLAPMEESEGAPSKKRGCCCALPGWPSGAYGTYYDTLEEASAQQKMSWQVFTAKVTGKGGA